MPATLNTATEIVKKYDGKCAICGTDYNHIHHIIPKAHGGSDKVGNLVALCYDCHLKAHNMTFTGRLALNDDILLKLCKYNEKTRFKNVVSVLCECISCLKQNLENERNGHSRLDLIPGLLEEIYEFEHAVFVLTAESD